MTHVDIISFADRRRLDQHLQALLDGQHVVPGGVALFQAFVERAFKSSSGRRGMSTGEMQSKQRRASAASLELDNVDLDVDISNSSGEDTDAEQDAQEIDAKDDLGSCSSMFVDLAVKVMVRLRLTIGGWDACMRVHRAALTQRLLELLDLGRRQVPSPPWLGLAYRDVRLYVLREAASSIASVRQAFLHVGEEMLTAEHPDTQDDAEIQAAAAVFMLSRSQPQRALQYARAALRLFDAHETPPLIAKAASVAALQPPRTKRLLVVAEGKIRERLAPCRAQDAFSRARVEALVSACEGAVEGSSGLPFLHKAESDNDVVRLLLYDSVKAQPLVPMVTRRRLVESLRHKGQDQLSTHVFAANLVHAALVASLHTPSLYEVVSSGVSTQLLFQTCDAASKICSESGGRSNLKTILDDWVRRVCPEESTHRSQDSCASVAFEVQDTAFGVTDSIATSVEGACLIVDGLDTVAVVSVERQKESEADAEIDRLLSSPSSDAQVLANSMFAVLWPLPSRCERLVDISRRLVKAGRGTALQCLCECVGQQMSAPSTPVVNGANSSQSTPATAKAPSKLPSLRPWRIAAQTAAKLLLSMQALAEAGSDSAETVLSASLELVLCSITDHKMYDFREALEQEIGCLEDDTPLTLLSWSWPSAAMAMSLLCAVLVHSHSAAVKALRPFPKSIAALSGTVRLARLPDAVTAKITTRQSQFRIAKAASYLLSVLCRSVPEPGFARAWLERFCPSIVAHPSRSLLISFACVKWSLKQDDLAVKLFLQSVRLQMNEMRSWERANTSTWSSLLEVEALSNKELLNCLTDSLGSEQCQAYMEAAILCQFSSPALLDKAFRLLQQSPGQLRSSMFVFMWHSSLIELVCSLCTDERRRQAALKQLFNPMLRLCPDSSEHHARKTAIQLAFVRRLLCDSRWAS